MKRFMLPVLAIVIAIAALMIPASASAATTAAPPTTKLCRNFTGSPCWAKTKLPSGAPICELGLPIPLFLRSGGKDCGPIGNLVLITCWYTGPPTVLGDDIQDHVTEETGGAQQLVGHIPDVYIDLGNHNPADVGIAHC